MADVFEVERADFAALHTADAGRLQDLRRFPNIFPNPQNLSVICTARR